MPSEDRTQIALDAIRPRKELFLSAVATTTEEIRSLLSGKGESTQDQTIALGNFAQGHVDVERFSAFTAKASQIDSSAEKPVLAAKETLAGLLAEGDDLFVLKVDEGSSLADAVSQRLARIGLAFAAAHVTDLAKRGNYREEEHGAMLDGLAYREWSRAERALAPGLVVELSGADFTPSAVAPFLDEGMKIVFVVEGDAPAAAMARLVTPGLYVQQTVNGETLEAFGACERTAAAALLPNGAAEFIHDPDAGETSFERFTTLELPREVLKRRIGGMSASQQAEDLALLESMAVVPLPGGEAASDPAGKLSAWLLSQANLAG
ncbi:MAG: hypothetical protein V2I79_04915 [Xanthomonadales bacterium]|jgi:hypothetical protein|nr:hypothetical protein [Xanthomonadales bacterium]